MYKILGECKALIERRKKSNLLKIIEIKKLSSIPGESEFLIQVTNKNSVFTLKANNIFTDGYNISDFSDFHAELIRQAAVGKLIDYLQNPSLSKSTYTVLSKKLNRELNTYTYEIEDCTGTQFSCTADEIYANRTMLDEMHSHDIFDIGFTIGSESISRESKQLKAIKLITERIAP